MNFPCYRLLENQLGRIDRRSLPWVRRFLELTQRLDIRCYWLPFHQYISTIPTWVDLDTPHSRGDSTRATVLWSKRELLVQVDTPDFDASSGLLPWRLSEDEQTGLVHELAHIAGCGTEPNSIQEDLLTTIPGWELAAYRYLKMPLHMYNSYLPTELFVCASLVVPNGASYFSDLDRWDRRTLLKYWNSQAQEQGLVTARGRLIFPAKIWPGQ